MIEMRGVKEEVSAYKKSAERMFNWFIEWKNDLIKLWKKIDKLKKVNDERELKFTEWSKERIEWNKERTELRREIDIHGEIEKN